MVVHERRKAADGQSPKMNMDTNAASIFGSVSANCKGLSLVIKQSNCLLAAGGAIQETSAKGQMALAETSSCDTMPHLLLCLIILL